jgi:hypothetical protein
MDIAITYERDWGLGWIAARPVHMRRASHALVAGGGVWLIDPVDGDGLADRIAALGPVRGVIQLLDRHRRDCAALAARHGAPLHVVPFGGVPGTPFEVLRVLDRRWWREAALWWPERRALAVGDALGTAPYFRAPGEALGVHPMLRLSPPRALAAPEPLHLLPGHGEPLEGPAVPGLVRRAVSGSRREIPRWLAGLPRAWRRGGRGG